MWLYRPVALSLACHAPRQHVCLVSVHHGAALVAVRVSHGACILLLLLQIVCRTDVGLGEAYMHGDYLVNDLGGFMALMVGHRVGTVHHTQQSGRDNAHSACLEGKFAWGSRWCCMPVFVLHCCRRACMWLAGDVASAGLMTPCCGCAWCAHWLFVCRLPMLVSLRAARACWVWSIGPVRSC